MLPTEGAVWWHTATVQALPHPFLEGMRCWWDRLDWGRSHGASSASSECSWLRVLQFICLHSLVNPYILILPQLLKPLLLCASEIPALSWTWVVSIGARGLENGGHVLGLPARNHFSTASSFLYPLYANGGLGNRISWNESWWLQNRSGQKSADHCGDMQGMSLELNSSSWWQTLASLPSEEGNRINWILAASCFDDLPLRY